MALLNFKHVKEDDRWCFANFKWLFGYSTTDIRYVCSILSTYAKAKIIPLSHTDAVNNTVKPVVEAIMEKGTATILRQL